LFYPTFAILSMPLYQAGETLTVLQLLGYDFVHEVTCLRYLWMGKLIIDHIARFSWKNYAYLTQYGKML